MESSSRASCSFLGKQEYFSSCLCSSFNIASHAFEDGAVSSTRNYTSPGTSENSFVTVCCFQILIVNKFIFFPLLIAQVQCPLEVINLHPSRDVAVLDFSYKFGNDMVHKFKLTNFKNHDRVELIISFQGQYKKICRLATLCCIQLHKQIILRYIPQEAKHWI